MAYLTILNVKKNPKNKKIKDIKYSDVTTSQGGDFS